MIRNEMVKLENNASRSRLMPQSQNQQVKINL